MQSPKFVLDMNYLESEELKKILDLNPEHRFVLPDVALVEMLKHPGWRLTIKLATGTLSKHIERVKVSLSIGEALSRELSSHQPIRADSLLSDLYTERVRTLIEVIGEDSAEIDAELETQVNDTRAKLLQEELNATEAKARTRKYLELLNIGFDPALIRKLRKPSLHHDVLVAFSYGTAHVFSWRMLTKENGMSGEEALGFLELNPLILRWQFLVVRSCIIHLRNGVDMEAYKESKELNNQLDLDFALTASYFDGLLSKDEGLLRAHNDLKSVLHTKRSELDAIVDDWLTGQKIANPR